MGLPEKYHIEQLRALRGSEHVTFPYDNAPNRRIERLQAVPRGASLGTYAVLQDEQYTGAVLVEQYILSGTQQYLELYQAFEDLPGPWIPGTRYDDDLGAIQTRRRAVLVADGQLASLSPTGRTTYEARGTSSLVAWEIEESWSDGTGEEGNPLYPVKTEDSYDFEKGPVETVSQFQQRNGMEVGMIEIVGGDFVQTSWVPTNNPGLIRKVVETFHLPGPIRARHDIDAETGRPVKIITQLVQNPTGDALDEYKETSEGSVEYRPTSSLHGLKVTMSLDVMTTPFYRVETRLAAYTYPALLFNVSGSATQALDGTVRVKLDWSRRASRTSQVPHSIEIYYGEYSELAEPANYFDPLKNDLIYDGQFFDVNERNVLNDEIGPLTFNTASDNPKWGAATEGPVSFAASPLSASEYVDLIGTDQTIACSKTKWKYGLWRMEIVKVQLR